LPWIHLAFFLSGLSGLLYEVLWTRMTTHMIGAAPYAVSLVLAVFMGGLGLGGYLGGRLADRQATASGLLRLYAALEAAVGLYALLLPRLFRLCKPLCAFSYRRLYDHPAAYHLFLFLFCAALLLPPVLWMGATLPILCRRITWTGGHWTARLGYLYGLNAVGAALGALLCGFWALENLGLTGTARLAAGLNALVAAGSFLSTLVKREQFSLGRPAMGLPVMERVGSGRSGEAQEKSGYPEGYDNLGVTTAWSGFPAILALWVFALSGFCAMACEVIWTRLLGLVLGPTPYAFTLVLFTFILGLALGNLLFGNLADRLEGGGSGSGSSPGHAWLLLAGTQAAAALLSLGASQLLGNSPVFFSKLAVTFRHGFWTGRALEAVALSVCMFPPAIAMGAAFPLIVRLGFRPGGAAGRYVGRAYAANTAGAVLGSLAAGLLLIPFVGKETALGLTAGLQALGALALSLTPLAGVPNRRTARILLAGSALGALALAPFLPSWDRLALSRSAYYDAGPELLRYGWAEALFRPRHRVPGPSGGEEVYYGDGIGGFTTVWRTMGPVGDEDFTLFNSGKADASAQADMFTQTLCAHFPMLFHPHARNVMVLGLASGITAGEVLHYPVESVDILEINRQVVDASRFFLPWNNGAVQHAKARLILQDGKAHLALTDRRYDVIISEPSNPWMAGLAELYSLDFFQSARDRLNADGIFVQFLHAYQMDWQTFAMVGRTFARAYPNSLLIRTLPSPEDSTGPASDYLLVGFKAPGGLAVENAVRNLAHAGRSRNVTLPNAGILYRLIESDDLAGLFGDGPLHTDDHPLLEFAASRLIYVDQGRDIRRHIRSGTPLAADLLARKAAAGGDVDAQIDFAAYALSVLRPFPDMVDLERADAPQRARYHALVEAYCGAYSISDYSPFTPAAVRRSCVSGQVKALRSRLATGMNRGQVLLAMASLIEHTGEAKAALPVYRSAMEAGGADPGVVEAARGRVEALTNVPDPGL